MSPPRRPDRGQALVEFAIVFPLQLLIVLGLLQLMQILVAKEMLTWAAFAAARAELVGESGQEAASLVMAPVSGPPSPPGAGAPADFRIPGWGSLNLSGYARSKTRAVRETEEGCMRVRVECDLPLWIPFANWAFHWAAGGENPVWDDVPHLTMTETARIPRPWEAP